MFSTRLLKQFVVLAEELHFGRAAARLHISQPPLSQAIMRLENALGAELFDRTGRSIVLTVAGSTFLNDARLLLEAQEGAIERARQAGAGLSGRIVLGFVGSVTYEMLPAFMTTMRHRFPGVRFDLRELPSVDQLLALHSRQLDLGIVRPPLADTNDLKLKVIRRERMVVVLPREHPLARLKVVPLSALASEAFMMFPPNRVPSLHAKTVMACDAAGFSPKVAMEAWQMPTMVSLVAIGEGVALLPEQVTRMPYPGVVYRPLSDRSAHLDLEIALVCRRDSISALVRNLMDALPAA